MTRSATVDPSKEPGQRSRQARVALSLLFLAGSIAALYARTLPAIDQYDAHLLLAAAVAAAISAVPLVAGLPVSFSSVFRPLHLSALLAAGAAAYAIVHFHFPQDFVIGISAALIILPTLIEPTNRAMPALAGAAVLLSVNAAAGWTPPPPAHLAGFGMLVILLTASASRARRAIMTERAAAHALRTQADSLTAENRAVRERSEVATALMEITNRLSAAPTPAMIAEEIARSTLGHLGAAGTILLLWDDSLKMYRIGGIAGAGAPPSQEIQSVELLADAIPPVSSTGVDPTSLPPASLSEPMLQSLLRTWHTRELLGVRLERNDQLLGLLLVARSASAEPMSRRDRHLLSRIAFQAASTLSQANLVADLQAANQLKEEFMATMSHELRTPLNVIIGYTDLQLDGAYGELTGEHRQALERIRDQSMQLLELIQATLDVSRLERGLLSLNLEDISIPQFMDELQQNIPSNWRKPTVALNYRIAPGIPMIRTDPAKLYILARNLIHNALKFTSSGAVTVSFSVNPNKQKVTFVVQDSGIGIKPEHLSDIFEKFRQIPAPDAEWVPSGGGVGLGLYIAKRLATVLGAEIDVSSTPRRGSTFRVHLPVGGPLAARR